MLNTCKVNQNLAKPHMAKTSSLNNLSNSLAKARLFNSKRAKAIWLAFHNRKEGPRQTGFLLQQQGTICSPTRTSPKYPTPTLKPTSRHRLSAATPTNRGA